jgi:hypothetical protein
MGVVFSVEALRWTSTDRHKFLLGLKSRVFPTIHGTFCISLLEVRSIEQGGGC